MTNEEMVERLARGEVLWIGTRLKDWNNRRGYVEEIRQQLKGMPQEVIVLMAGPDADLPLLSPAEMAERGWVRQDDLASAVRAESRACAQLVRNMAQEAATEEKERGRFPGPVSGALRDAALHISARSQEDRL